MIVKTDCETDGSSTTSYLVLLQPRVPLAGRERSHHAWRVETSSLGCNVVLLATFYTSINAKNIRK